MTAAIATLIFTLVGYTDLYVYFSPERIMHCEIRPISPSGDSYLIVKDDNSIHLWCIHPEDQ